MRKLSQGVFEFSRSHIQEVVAQDIKTGILIAESMFLITKILSLVRN